MYDYDIIVLTETNLNDSIYDNELFDARYNTFRRDRQHSASIKESGGGVLIAVLKDYEVSCRRDWESHSICEDVWLTLKLKKGSSLIIINICAAYIPPNIKVNCFEVFLDNVSKIISSEVASGSQSLVLGDFNLPYFKWQSDTNLPHFTPQPGPSAQDALFLDTMEFNGLHQFNGVLNDNSRILDLVLSTEGDNKIIVTKNNIHLTKLDLPHHPALHITLNVGLLKFLKRKHSREYKYYKSDYNTINERLSCVDWGKVLEIHDNIDAMVTAFYNIFLPIVQDCTPLQFSKNERYPIWFSLPLIKCMKEKAKYHSKYKNYSNLQDKLAFVDARKRCNTLLKECFATFKNNTSLFLKKNPKHIWRYVKNLKGNNASLPNQMILENTTAVGGQAICNLFSEHFNSIYQDTASDDTGINRDALKNDANDTTSTLCMIHVEEHEVLEALLKLDGNKGAGPDSLPSIVLKQCAQQLAWPLSVIFNKSLSLGVFPSKWKVAYITPIHKKGDLSRVDNYRPVSILSGIGKLLESFVVKKMYWHLSPYLNTNQHGFRPRKSTTTNLIGYVNDILEVLDKGGEVHAIYTDFSKAFDLVSHDLLLAKLQGLGIHGTLLRWFESYLRNRSQLVVAKGFKSSKMPVPSGVPQGSHVGPILFLGFINDLPSAVNSKVKLFADDLKLYRQIRNQKDVDELQADINSVSRWCVMNNMRLNASKCFLIKFSRKHNPNPANYAINNAILKQVTSMRDLGVVVDTQLNFHEHIDLITRKASKMCGFVSRQAKSFKNKQLSLLLYNSIVRSVLEYCSVVWNPGYQVHADRLERVQKRFMYHLAFMQNKCKVLRSYESRLKHYNVMPLQKRRVMADIVMLYKLFNGLVDCPDILEKIKIRVPLPCSRLVWKESFKLPRCRTNMLLHSPLVRMCASYDKEAIRKNIDIFKLGPLSSLKIGIKNLLK